MFPLLHPQQQRSLLHLPPPFFFSSLTSFFSYSTPLLSPPATCSSFSTPPPTLCISPLHFGAQQHLAVVAMETVVQQQVGCCCCLGAWHPSHPLCSCPLAHHGGLQHLRSIHESRQERPSGSVTTQQQQTRVISLCDEMVGQRGTSWSMIMFLCNIYKPPLSKDMSIHCKFIFFGQRTTNYWLLKKYTRFYLRWSHTAPTGTTSYVKFISVQVSVHVKGGRRSPRARWTWIKALRSDLLTLFISLESDGTDTLLSCLLQRLRNNSGFIRKEPKCLLNSRTIQQNHNMAKYNIKIAGAAKLQQLQFCRGWRENVWEHVSINEA